MLLILWLLVSTSEHIPRVNPLFGEATARAAQVPHSGLTQSFIPRLLASGMMFHYWGKELATNTELGSKVLDLSEMLGNLSCSSGKQIKTI